nr:hypothetical protein [Tanacetum cinerariifolium]
MKIFDELEKEYDQCVIDNKSLEIENKNLLIQNECLLAESISKDICSIMLTFDIHVPMSVEPRNLELEAEILKYVPPQKRNNREVNAPSPRKEKVSLVKKTNVSVNLSTGIKSITESSKSKSKYETKTHINLPAKSENVKRVENPLRNLNKRNRVDSILSVKHTGFISKSASVCKTCNDCLVFSNHDKCGVKNLKSMNAKNPKVKNDANVKQDWKATGKVFASVDSKWKPTRRKFTLGDTFSKKPLTSYKRKDRKIKDTSTGSPPNAETQAVNDHVNVVQIFLWYLDSGFSQHMTGDRSKLINYVEKFIGTVRFRNDQFAAIVGYGDYKIGDTIITRVYYVERLIHNLFSVGQFCDA